MNQKQQKSSKTIMRTSLLILLTGFIFSNLLAAAEFTVLKDPKATFTENEKNYVMLEKVNQLTDSIDQEEFLAFPRAIAADDKGNIYVFDTIMVKIFKYDRDLKLVKSFGQQGQGPTDFMVPHRGTDVGLYCTDEKLYVLIGKSKQLIVLDKDLNYVGEFRQKLPERYLTRHFTVNKDGDFVFYSRTGNGIWWVYDHEMKFKSKFSIDLKLFEFLFFEPPRCLFENMSNTNKIEIKHDIAKNSKLLVYCKDTSSLFVFNNNRLEKRFNLYSRKILDKFKPRLARTLEEFSGSSNRKIGNSRIMCGYRSVFTNFFIDKDTGKSFYLEYRDGDAKKIYLYNFDLEGKLLKINQVENKNAYRDRTVFKLKRNNIFYAVVSNETIVTYKEEKK
jgi:DNA-binding beta-propeller fold protein YncE